MRSPSSSTSIPARRGVGSLRTDRRAGLVARPATGRPPELTRTQEKIIRRWRADKPTEHGRPTGLWTGPKVAHMIREEIGVEINAKDMTVRLRRREFIPQKPRRVLRQRDRR